VRTYPTQSRRQNSTRPYRVSTWLWTGMCSFA